MDIDKKENEEELFNRRQFFKKAAKSVLPILGAIALSNVPLIGKAMNHESSTEMGCNWGCTYGCSGSCGGACSMSCQNTCSGSCQGRCSGTCQSSCRGYY